MPCDDTPHAAAADAVAPRRARAAALVPPGACPRAATRSGGTSSTSWPVSICPWAPGPDGRTAGRRRDLDGGDDGERLGGSAPRPRVPLRGRSAGRRARAHLAAA